jgi:hypothetical protein
VAPARTTVRYTPYLNYLLNKSWPEKIDWLTAKNGDKVRLRGRYRIELVRNAELIDSQEPDIDSMRSIKFD